MTDYTENDWWSFLSSSKDLKHSWGTKPEQKAREQEYNHEYYEKNKERILDARKRHGYSSSKSKDIKSEDDIDSRVDSETKSLEKLIKSNEGLDGDSDDVRQHNQNIIDNIRALSDKVKSYIAENPDMSSEQKAQLLASLRDQIDKAKELALDLKKGSTQDYLTGKETTSTKKSSTKSSKKKSEEKSVNEEVDWIGELQKEAEEVRKRNPNYKLPDDDFGEFYAELAEIGYPGDRDEARKLFERIRKK